MDLIQQLLVDLKVQGNGAGAVEYQRGLLLFSSLEKRTIGAHDGHCQEFFRVVVRSAAMRLEPLALRCLPVTSSKPRGPTLGSAQPIKRYQQASFEG
jgi:hypothetical protein